MDETVASFPTYADLTQTRGWAGEATSAITGAFDDTAELALEGARYTEGALLGQGGMGKVVLARDARIGREVAVKQLHAERELTPDERARFLREARVQGQLEHPSIVPVYDIDRRPDGTTFFTMRRVVGRTLHAILEDLRVGEASARARFTQRELLTAFATVCLTIDYAHARGVIHRDLKPANIMLGDFGEVYVLDWGLARVLDETAATALGEPAGRLSRTGDLMGTPLYMAPEQMADPGVGPAADVFALGAILFEILTLQRLRDASTLYLPAEARPSVRAPALGIAPELEAMCERATQSDPADRYPSVRALHDALVRYLEGDREMALRRDRAAAHAKTAAEALARGEAPGGDFEHERGIAMQELSRALALDPDDDELVARFATLLATPPRVVPEIVRRQELDNEERLVRIGARYSIGASLSWFLFLPLVAYMGFIDGNGWRAALILGPTLLSAVGCSVALFRTRPMPLWLQLAVITLTLVGAAAAGQLFGSMVLVPTLIATFCIVLQAHPNAFARGYVWIAGSLALALPIVLEATGAVTSMYRFDGGRITIEPLLVAFPRDTTFLLVLTASLAMMSVPCIFIGRLRIALNEAQRAQLLQTWHLARLGGAYTARSSPRLAAADRA